MKLKKLTGWDLAWELIWDLGLVFVNGLFALRDFMELSSPGFIEQTKFFQILILIGALLSTTAALLLIVKLGVIAAINHLIEDEERE